MRLTNTVPSLASDFLGEDIVDVNESSSSGSDESSSDGSSSESSDEEPVIAGVSQAETAAEVDDDFERLVQSIRQGDGLSSAPGQTWDFNLEDKETEFKNDLREASGVGRRKGNGRRKRRAGPVLSQQVKALIGEGNQAYIDNDIPETIRIMQEVIRIEPRAASAWSVLAQCYDIGNLNEPQRALQLRIMAAHLNQDPEEWDRLALESKNLGYHQQALYCYRKLYNLDPSNAGALWDRAALAKEINDLRTARHSLLAILKLLPHDLTVLEELRPVLIELSDLALCADLFQQAFDHYQRTFPTGVATNSETGAELPGGGFGLMEVLVLADLYNTLGAFDKAIVTIKKGCRWLQGRAMETFWDKVEDDREYDVEDVSETRVTEGEIGSGQHPLDVNARHRLAIARIRLGDIAEGRNHAKVILSQSIAEYAPLFAEIADAYFDRELYAEAGQIYEMLGADAETSSLYVLLQAASCRRMVGDLKESAEVYEHVIAADPTNNDAKMKLAEIYEILGEVRRALDLVHQVIDSRRRKGHRQDGDDGSQDPSASLFNEKSRGKKPAKARPPKLSAAQMVEMEAAKEREVSQAYHRIKDLWPRMLGGEEGAVREWLFEADKLVEMYRVTRALFLTTKPGGFRGMFPSKRANRQRTEANEDDMASRLQLELGRDALARKSKASGSSNTYLDHFRGISFDDWLRLFMQYAFLLTKRGDFELAHEVLRHISFSNPFQNREKQDIIRLAIVACAIGGDQPGVIVEQARKLVNTHQFNNEPYRILIASLGSGMNATDGFIASTLSKHMLREIKLFDLAHKNKDALKWNPNTKRYALVGSSTKEEEDEDDVPITNDKQNAQPQARLPTKDNPIGVALYGQICLAAKSYQSAIFYLLHAYDYCPYDPVVCLCLAVASIGRAMQRQADNRHHLVTQAMTFLTKYRALRGTNAEGMEEVEYNFGRAFHHLGLMALATHHYSRVLQLVENRLAKGDQDVGLAGEAAYNLSLIYVSTGATALAEKLYRRWLSL
ncbi:TPR-like protein [Panus rudis PR-1116 ss-1]|nr:TPR-like protein [Panus rudis PR-1116 ss-1]